MKKLLVNTLLVAGLASVLPGQTYNISTVAGSPSSGLGDGSSAVVATVNTPVHAVADAAGNIYVSDLVNGQGRIRKIDALTGIITTLTTSASAPRGLALDKAGAFLYVADDGSARIRKVDTTTGANTTVAGTGDSGFSGDGRLAINGRIRNPRAVWLDANGNILFADTLNNRIRRVNATTGIVSTVAGRGPTNNTPTIPAGNLGLTVNFVAGDGGKATLALLGGPEGVVGDPAGNIYIADTIFNRIRQVSTGGIITTVAGLGTSGSQTGVTLNQAQFNAPKGLAWGSDGNLYVADSGNNRIQQVNFTTGIVRTVAGGGSGGDNTQAAIASLSAPSGVSFDSGGNMLIADQNGSKVRKVDATTGLISTIAGTAGGRGDNGPASLASFTNPRGVVVANDGTVYVSDTNNHKVRKVDATSGIITGFLGTGVSGNTVDVPGTPVSASSARISFPGCVALDGLGNVFVADRGNAKVRRVDPTGQMTTVANSSGTGYNGDANSAIGIGILAGGATSTNTSGPNCVAAAANGDFYIADTSNNVIRKVSNGIITTVVGFPTVTVGANGIPVNSGVSGFSGDNGPATDATLNGPQGIGLNADGTKLCVADTGNHVIRELDIANNTIITVAGIPNDSNGDTFTGSVVAVLRRLSSPAGCAYDNAGNIYIADTGANRINKVTPAGQMSQIAGGGSDFLGDGKAALNARINGPVGIDVDNNGNVFFTDRFGIVKKLTVAPATP